MPGGMGVKKNIHIEEWASFRENCEHVFKFSKANFARLAVFGIAVPVGMYYWITYEFRKCGHPVGFDRTPRQYRYLGFDIEEK